MPLTPAELAARVLAIVAATPGGEASFPWVEVQLLASYPTPQALATAPDSFTIRDAVWGLVETDKLKVTAGRWVSVKG